MDKELLLNPICISRNAQERTLIEASVNSVRVSIAIKQADEMEIVLADRFARFLMQRAEDFVILRRKPVEVSNVVLYQCFAPPISTPPLMYEGGTGF